jgi:hypothetical protein
VCCQVEITRVIIDPNVTLTLSNGKLTADVIVWNEFDFIPESGAIDPLKSVEVVSSVTPRCEDQRGVWPFVNQLFECFQDAFDLYSTRCAVKVGAHNKFNLLGQFS